MNPAIFNPSGVHSLPSVSGYFTPGGIHSIYLSGLNELSSLTPTGSFSYLSAASPVGVYSIFWRDATEVHEGSFSRSGYVVDPTSVGLPQRLNEPSFTSVETYKKVKEP